MNKQLEEMIGVIDVLLEIPLHKGLGIPMVKEIEIHGDLIRAKKKIEKEMNKGE